MMQHYRTHLSPRSRRCHGMHGDEHLAEHAGAFAAFPAASRSAFSPYTRPFVQSPPPPPAHSQWPCY
ncbi:hypothetical protein H4R19_004203 [Coemansia spiralis]|nr:hypothetical protein H4R19_004203 [Coemansia spiralis]